jgi:hypothetical protein
MSIEIEQCVLGLDSRGDGRFLGVSPGVLDVDRQLITRMAELPFVPPEYGGAVTVFSLPYGRVAVMKTFPDWDRHGRVWPYNHVLLLGRQEYEAIGADPFLLVEGLQKQSGLASEMPRLSPPGQRSAKSASLRSQLPIDWIEPLIASALSGERTYVLLPETSSDVARSVLNCLPVVNRADVRFTTCLGSPKEKSALLLREQPIPGLKDSDESMFEVKWCLTPQSGDEHSRWTKLGHSTGEAALLDVHGTHPIIKNIRPDSYATLVSETLRAGRDPHRIVQLADGMLRGLSVGDIAAVFSCLEDAGDAEAVSGSVVSASRKVRTALGNDRMKGLSGAMLTLLGEHAGKERNVEAFADIWKEVSAWIDASDRPEDVARILKHVLVTQLASRSSVAPSCVATVLKTASRAHVTKHVVDELAPYAQEFVEVLAAEPQGGESLIAMPDEGGCLRSFLSQAVVPKAVGRLASLAPDATWTAQANFWWRNFPKEAAAHESWRQLLSQWGKTLSAISSPDDHFLNALEETLARHPQSLADVLNNFGTPLGQLLASRSKSKQVSRMCIRMVVSASPTEEIALTRMLELLKRSSAGDIWRSLREDLVDSLAQRSIERPDDVVRLTMLASRIWDDSPLQMLVARRVISAASRWQNRSRILKQFAATMQRFDATSAAEVIAEELLDDSLRQGQFGEFATILSEYVSDDAFTEKCLRKAVTTVKAALRDDVAFQLRRKCGERLAQRFVSLCPLRPVLKPAQSAYHTVASERGSRDSWAPRVRVAIVLLCCIEVVAVGYVTSRIFKTLFPPAVPASTPPLIRVSHPSKGVHGGWDYIVQDTDKLGLDEILRRYLTCPGRGDDCLSRLREEVVRLNSIEDPDMIRVGQKLYIPFVPDIPHMKQDGRAELTTLRQSSTPHIIVPDEAPPAVISGRSDRGTVEQVVKPAPADTERSHGQPAVEENPSPVQEAATAGAEESSSGSQVQPPHERPADQSPADEDKAKPPAKAESQLPPGDQEVDASDGKTDTPH